MYKCIFFYLCSASLSSMESETEDPFADSTANLLTTDSSSFCRQKLSKNIGQIGRRFSGNASTHSLNETDYQVQIVIINIYCRLYFCQFDYYIYIHYRMVSIK